MALKPCPECSKDISSDAPACPHCGYQSRPVVAVSKRNTGTDFIFAISISFIVIIILAMLMAHNGPSTATTALKAASCTIDDFKISSWQWVQNRDDLHVTGEFVNHCETPAGVQFQISVRDRGGQVLDVHEPWPASTLNIEPNTPYPFSLDYLYNPSTDTVSMKIINVEHWGKY